MFGSPILDVAIGLALTYLLLSLICTAVNEWIAGLFSWRAATLQEAIRKLLDAPPDGSYELRPTDIKDGSGLIKALRVATGPEATLRAKLPPDVLAQIDAGAATPPVSELLAQVIAAFNSAIDGPLLKPGLFPAGRLQPDTVAEATAALSKNNTASGPGSQKLNRLMLQQYFGDFIASLSDLFYGHALIKSLETSRGALPRFLARFSGTGADRHPSYIPSSRFALALVDVVSQYAGDAQDFQTALKNLPDSDVRSALLALTRHGAEKAQGLLKSVETWFDETMERVSGSYKRKMQVVTLLIAAAVTLLANADTVLVANRLWASPTLRAAAVQAAQSRAGGSEAGSPAGTAQPVLSQADQDLLTQLIGWQSDGTRLHAVLHPASGPLPANPRTAALGWIFGTLVPERLAGWLVTMIAISLGAPFWFDTLNKFMNIRSSGKKPDESPKTN